MSNRWPRCNTLQIAAHRRAWTLALNNKMQENKAQSHCYCSHRIITYRIILRMWQV